MDDMICWHMVAFLCGSVLDLIIGDPHSIPHPVQLIGKLIAVLDDRFQKRAEIKGRADEKDRRGKAVPALKRRYGRLMALIVVVVTAAVSALILFAGYRIHAVLGFVLESVMTCQIFAGRSLERESMKVYDRLTHGTLPEARKAVSMIVGRDTENLSKEQVTKAAVETVAENTSDGVIAPMLYTALGGPVLGWIYKAVNTMDSMVGYKNDRYLDFGRGPAHLDDAVNYLPSRISALLMIAAAWLLRFASDKSRRKTAAYHSERNIFRSENSGRSDSFTGYDARNAARIWKRDRRKHASPNSAQTESVMAGALRVQLAGDAYYFGKLVKKPFIGDALRPIEPEDIRRANHLMLGTAFLCEMICLLTIGLVD